MNKDSFLDGKTLFAIVFTMAAIFGWQAYLQKKYPQRATSEVEAPAAPSSTEKAAPNQNEKPQTKSFTNDLKNTNEQTLSFKSDQLNFEISSYGMGIKNVELNKYTDRKGEKIQIGTNLKKEYLFEFKAKDSGSERFPFEIKKVSENEYTGLYKNGQSSVLNKYIIHPETYSVDVEIRLMNFAHENSIVIPETIVPQEGGGNFLMPSYENQSVFIVHSNTTERAIIHPNKLENPFTKEFSNVGLASVGSLYFVSALIDSSPLSPFFSTNIQRDDSKDMVVGSVKYVFPETNKENTIKYKFYVGPKDVKLLEKVDERLSGTVNFGWFSFIAKPLLKLMKVFNSLFHNYGVAIILLTLTVRLILLPINVSSYRSMKKMQQIQPLVKEIKEKYKEDPKKLNEETMRLFTQNKVNPFGGCLPLLLQFPIFISLYGLLGHSIELYKAPFIFWIHDLSYKDPYYVLPLLMGISMFVQQKITPSTMDPTQQKVLMFMPVFFAFLMFGLPSGLTLYIFVSTLFGIIQQFLFLKDKHITKQTLK